MRIAYISGTPLPSRVASAINIMKMCRGLARAGHEVTLFARRGAGSAATPREVLATYGLDEEFELVLRAPPGIRGSKNLIYPLSVARELARRPRPDLLYGRHAYALALAARAVPEVPVAYEAHTFPRKRLRRLAERWLFRRAGFRSVVAISQALADDYRTGFADLPGLDIFVAHDAADPVEPSGQLPDPWPGRPGVRQVGYAGHLYPGKGMEVVAALAARLPGLDFHAVGGEEGDIAAWRARTGGLENLHMHGFVPHARVADYLARFDVLLAPPTGTAHSALGRDIGRWMSPLKVFEYMATGKPIIASDIPVIREILVDGRTALLAPPQDIDAWVAALARLEDPAFAAALGARSQAEFRARHSWDARAVDVLAHLSRAVPAPVAPLQAPVLVP
jgi:glycosyltransferase involved in cell wall biosynthesis